MQHIILFEDRIVPIEKCIGRETVMADRIGQQLGNYRLIRLLGTGAFAEVYLGEHVYLKRQAAIKVLHTVLREEQKADFLIEAQRLVDLSHPSIIPVFDFAIEGDLPYLVMEYAPNGTLRTRHPKGSCLSLETIVPYVRSIAASLQYIHEQKLVHRDVKPENILVGKNQEILLSDFGIAAIAHKTSSLSMQGQAGTPAYMAPEQSQGLARAASDQYALGIMVYEWLCGTLPFQGSSVMGLAMQHLYALPPSLCQRIPTLPPAVEKVVLKALAKEPQQRFSTITEFAETLEQASQTVQTVTGVSSLEQNPLPSSPLSSVPTVLLAEPMQKQYTAIQEVMPPRPTQPLAPLPQHIGRAQGYTPIEDNVIARPVAVRHLSSESHSRKPYASPLPHAIALPKSKGLPDSIKAIPLIVLALGIAITGFILYWPSLAKTPSPHSVSTSPTPPTSTVQQIQPNVLAEDTFQRPNQDQWGTASDGHHQWVVGDANTKQFFSISNRAGSIAKGQGHLEALIGSAN
jgi:serine/threonine protein kinase